MRRPLRTAPNVLIVRKRALISPARRTVSLFLFFTYRSFFLVLLAREVAEEKVLSWPYSVNPGSPSTIASSSSFLDDSLLTAFFSPLVLGVHLLSPETREVHRVSYLSRRVSSHGRLLLVLVRSFVSIVHFLPACSVRRSSILSAKQMPRSPFVVRSRQLPCMSIELSSPS